MLMIKYFDLHVFMILILSFLLVFMQQAKRFYARKDRLFRFVLLSNILALAVEIASWLFNQKPGMINNALNQVTNYALFALSLAPLSTWLIYLDEIILDNASKKAKKCRSYIFLNGVLLFLLIINPIFKLLFTIDSTNTYIRGPLFPMVMAFNLLLIAGYLVSIIKYRRILDGRVLKTILMLSFFPVIGAVLQVAVYGISLVWPSMALVGLFGYILLEHEEMQRDALTGLFNRAQLEKSLLFKLSRRQPFTLLMLDVDHFKLINDQYGHHEGDEALQAIARTLSKSFMITDSVFRFAGDEFMIIIDSESEVMGIKAVERIHENMALHNQYSEKPYQLEMSIGHLFYDGGDNLSLLDMIREVDTRMYVEKRAKAE